MLFIYKKQHLMLNYLYGKDLNKVNFIKQLNIYLIYKLQFNLLYQKEKMMIYKKM